MEEKNTLTKEELKLEKTKMRKINMKIFPIYKMLGWDYLFFYTIDFLFLTQVKGISPANVILKSSFYSFFSIILQIPSNLIVEFLGRKNSIILGNILNCLYMVIVMMSRNLGDLIFAEFISAAAFSIKGIAEPSLLNQSVPPSKRKSEIFLKLNAKGTSGYYVLNAISKILAGYLFMINGYLPIYCSIAVLILVTILSMGFVEPIKSKKVKIDYALGKTQLKEIKSGFAYVLKSERLKALIICGALIATLLKITGDYNVSLLEELDISSFIIGIIAATGSLLSAFACKKLEFLNRNLKNKTLITLAMSLCINLLLTGILGLTVKHNVILIIIMTIAYGIFDICEGLYYTTIEKYLRNFTNKNIDTKIFAANNLIKNIAKTLGGVAAAFLIDRQTTGVCMIIVALMFSIVFIIVEKYMKPRVGLKPEQYSKEERKYDEMLTK